jgi:MFS family permease
MSQALCMGAFGIFWTAVPLRLMSPPFELHQTGIALFALAGVGGAIVAPIAGWAGDRGWSRIATGVARTAIIAAAILAGLAGAGWFGFETRPMWSLGLLAVAAIMLDFDVVGDQTLGRRAVNLLSASAQGRLNALYTGVFFVGGTIGSAVAGIAWMQGGWTLVCLIALGFGFAASTLAAFEL